MRRHSPGAPRRRPIRRITAFAAIAVAAGLTTAPAASAHTTRSKCGSTPSAHAWSIQAFNLPCGRARAFVAHDAKETPIDPRTVVPGHLFSYRTQSGWFCLRERLVVYYGQHLAMREDCVAHATLGSPVPEVRWTDAPHIPPAPLF